MKLIATLLFLVLPLYGFPQTTEIARKNFIETVKNYCIGQWSSKERIDILSKFATLSEQCKCVEEEMNYSSSDDMAKRLIQMQIQANNADVKYLSEDVVLTTIKEWDANYSVAHRVCTERFIRRRQSTR